jgi:hypothetical protein
MKVFLIKGDTVIIETEGFKVSEVNAQPHVSLVHFGTSANRLLIEMSSNWKIIEGIDVNELWYAPETFSFMYRKIPICIRTGNRDIIPLKTESFRLFYEVESGIYSYQCFAHYASKKTVPVFTYINNSPLKPHHSAAVVKLDFIGSASAEFNTKEGDLTARLGIVNDSELAVQLVNKVFREQKHTLSDLDFL